jgi:hypothetical protein
MTTPRNDSPQSGGRPRTPISVEAPDFITATDLQLRLRDHRPSLRPHGDGQSYELGLVVRDPRPVLGRLQEWLEEFGLGEIVVRVGSRPYQMRSRRLDWIDR